MIRVQIECSLKSVRSQDYTKTLRGQHLVRAVPGVEGDRAGCNRQVYTWRGHMFRT